LLNKFSVVNYIKSGLYTGKVHFDRMEDELIAQRDAAIAVNKELQKQLQHHKEVVERTIERRALK
jgi:hypothetical protein